MKFHLRFSLFLLLFIAGKINAQLADPNAPVMQFDSLEYHFGTVVQGSVFTHEFHFTNTGKSPLIISDGITNTGATVVEYPKEPIAPGRSSVIKFTFNTVGRMGPQNKSAWINSNNLDGQVILKMTGAVIAKPVDPNAPVMHFDSLEYNFGSVMQGTEIRHRFHFTNTGKTDLIISNVYSSDGGGVPVSWPKEPVKPGRSGIIELMQNTSGRMGAMDKVSTIVSNNRDGNMVLHLKGYVYTDPNAPVLEFKTTQADFGTVTQGTIITSEFQFTNTGKTPLILQEMYTNTGAAVADYPREPIAPGKTGVIKYRYHTAGKIGNQSKTLVVNSNNRDGTIILRITGNVEVKPVENPPPPSPR